MNVDYIIVGQGLAGSLMAYDLINRGYRILVFDQPDKNHSSSVAAGLFNPITGRRFVKTWKADILFPFLKGYYSSVEEKLGSRFFYELPLFRPFHSIEEQNNIVAESNTRDLGDFIDEIITENRKFAVSNSMGGVFIKTAGFVDIPEFIKTIRTLIKQKANYKSEQFIEEKLIYKGSSLQYENIFSKKIIYCDGASASRSKFFKWLPFRPVKGELIYVNIDTPFEFIYNRNIFILPYHGIVHKVGSTYDWEKIDIKPTIEGKNMLENKLKGILDVNFKTINHLAGIRPATKDRRPFIGTNPEFKNIGIFNGLGSKGVSLGPYFASKFSDCLENGTEIEFEANIKRYISVY